MRFIALAASAMADVGTNGWDYSKGSYIGPKPDYAEGTDDKIRQISKIRPWTPYEAPEKAYPWTPDLLPECPGADSGRTLLDDQETYATKYPNVGATCRM